MTVGAFDYVVSLRLAGRRAVVVGDGPVAAQRAEDLRSSGADVTVVAAYAHVDLVAAADADPGIRLVRRAYAAGDLDGAALAIATREGELDIDAFWAESRERGVLASVLDDLDHADFAAPALVRRGDLRIALSTAGRAPALAKRLREHLDDVIGPEYDRLVHAVDEARSRLGPRDVPFDEWSQRWSAALADLDGLLSHVGAGDIDAAVDHIVSTVRPSREPS